jgi:hypothetical protein
MLDSIELAIHWEIGLLLVETGNICKFLYDPYASLLTPGYQRRLIQNFSELYRNLIWRLKFLIY